MTSASGSAPLRDQPDEIDRLIVAMREGDADAADLLMPVLYDELRRLAGRQMRRERSNHTLQGTALVHEAYMRLLGQDRVQWQNKAHFMAIAATVMRRILINHEQHRRRLKRGGDRRRLALDTAIIDSNDKPLDLLEVDDALKVLAAIDKRQAQIVEMRFFGGLTEAETAHALDVSERTVRREWAMARAWLRARFAEGEDHGDDT